MVISQPNILFLRSLSKCFIVESEEASSINYLQTLFSPTGTNCIVIEHENQNENCIRLYNRIVNAREFDDKKNEIKTNFKYVGDKFPFVTTKYSVYEHGSRIAYVYEDSNKYASEFILEVNNRNMYIYAHKGKSDYKTLARIIREIATRDLEDNGYATFHASCADINGSGVLVIGNPGAGKSTLCLSLCKFQKARFVANDRVFIKKESEELSVVPFSFATKINKGTLKTLEINEEEYGGWELSEPIPSTDTDWDTYNGEYKMQLYVDELKKYIDIDSVSHTKLRLIVIPNINSGNGVLKIEPKYDMNVIKENCYSIYDPDFKDDWLGLRMKNKNIIDKSAEDVMNKMDCLKILHIEYSFDRIKDVCRIINEVICNK